MTGPLLLVLACGRDPWTAEGVAAGALGAVDRDGVSGLSAEEYAMSARSAPRFAAADGDGDGRIDAAELLALVRSEDPLEFDGGGKRESVDPREWAKPFEDPQASQRVWEALTFLREELLAARPGMALPDREAIRVAAATGSLTSPESTEVLRALLAGYETAGLLRPGGLDPEAAH